MYRLVVRAQAKLGLEKEIEYSRRNWGDKQARKYKQGLTKALKELKQNAKIYQIKTGFKLEIRIRRYKGSQIIYYLNGDQNLVKVLDIMEKTRKLTPLILYKRYIHSSKSEV